PVLTHIEKNIYFNWNPDGHGDVDVEWQVVAGSEADKYGSPKSGVINTNYWSARYTGFLKSPGTGIYEIGFLANDGGRLFIDDELVVDNWLADLPGQLKSAYYKFEADRLYKIRAENYEVTGTSHFRLGFEPYVPDNNILENALALAKESDIVVLCLGLNKKMEGEANDRTELGLEIAQLELLKEVVAVNKNTIVVLNNGNPITMSEWIDDVPAIVNAFYPGQEGGNALADILFGDVNPSGKLPVTFLKRWEDSPAFGTYPGIREKAIYSEGIFVGYRHFDKENIEPLFPFGFGLSYTTFEFSDLKLSKESMTESDSLFVEVTITNSGKIDGDEIVQLYISDKESSVEREAKSLKGFARVSLEAGESKTVTMKIDKSALSFYNVDSKSWVVEPGEFEV
ncbi:MAG: glycoside hydrolase family 3 C-terminal domain-containing protein, partial [Melioribacteraceae bacterium]|nr:glycoside hydrolase family 3 C-terminal domain-containing protein [Melioribacteraceae bacterium]